MLLLPMLVVAVALLAPAGVSAQFAVYPVQLDVMPLAGLSTEMITVENQGREPLEAVVYLSDYDRGEDGSHAYMAYGDHPNTCAERLEVFPDRLSVPAGERGEIRIRVEPGTTPCWGVVFVEKRTLTPSGIVVAQRIGVKVLGQAGGQTREGRVLGVSEDPASAADSVPVALVAFANDGTAVLEVTGEIEVRDLAGEVLGVVEVEGFRVLPGRKRYVRVPLVGPELPAGRYLLVAILDFGADYLVGGQTLLEVRP